MNKKRPLLQNFSALGIGCLLLGALNGPVLANSDGGPSPDSSEPLLRPVKVVSTTGKVSNAEALIEGRGGSATLTMVQGATAPMIILDYGRDVGGLPVFEVTSVTGTPKLQAIYSEAQRYLLPDGDAVAGVPQNPQVAQPEVSFVGDAAAADLSRVDTYPISRPGLIVNRLIQGGERFQVLTLASPGSVTLRQVGVQAMFFIPPPSTHRGFFHCSDPALNEIWHLGSKAVELCSVPAGSLPTTWTVTAQGVKVPGNEFTGYQGGAAWTDYTATFDVQVLSNEAAWLVRNTFFDSSGFRLVLAADNDDLGISKPNTLRAYSQFDKTVLGEATLPVIKAGSWHNVRNVLTGNIIQVYIDNQLVLTLNVAGVGGLFGPITAGTVGFGNEQGAEGLFRNLVVTDTSHNVLYQSSLTDPSILDQFAAGTNVLPSIMDGAKRDRNDYSGDIAISGLTLLYSTFAREYLAGSIELFSSFQGSNGGIATVLPPQYHPGVTPPDSSGASALGIPDYTLQHVTSIYHYYLYTGDKAFLQAQWPVVQKVITLYASFTSNPLHLVITPGSPSADTLNNAHFYGVLLQGAQLAEAMGHADVAAGYRVAAAQLRQAINTVLYNSTTGLYDVNTAQKGVADQHGNSYAVLYGVAPAPGTTVTSILQKLTAALYRTPTAPNATGPMPVQQSSGSTQVGTYTSAYELFARFENDDTANALALIRNEWGLMRKSSANYSDYSGATWEYVALDGTPGLGELTSLAHGWSSGPTSALSKYVLGVRPIQPGYQTWLVEPQPGDLSWVTGRVPTPYGPIAVGWRQNRNGFEVTVSVPWGTSGTVGIPPASGTVSVTDNGRVIKSMSASNVPNGRTGYVYVQNLQPGEHVILTTAQSH